MMTEDDLHNRLHQEAASVRPPDDLMETLAVGHARQHRRAARLKVGGTAAAIVAIATVLTSVFATSGGPSVQTAAVPTRAEIIQRAQEADTAAKGMVLHTTTIEGSGAVHDGWVQQSTNLSRITRVDVDDTVRKPDGSRETVDYVAKAVRTSPKEPAVVPFYDVVGSGLLAPGAWYQTEGLVVDPPQGGQVRLTLPLNGVPAHLWLDLRTYRPARAEYGSNRTAFEWLSPTAENLALLNHTVPSDYTR